MTRETEEAGTCQWTSWHELGDCDREATERVEFMGETVHVCKTHAKKLENRL